MIIQTVPSGTGLVGIGARGGLAWLRKRYHNYPYMSPNIQDLACATFNLACGVESRNAIGLILLTILGTKKQFGLTCGGILCDCASPIGIELVICLIAKNLDLFEHIN